MNSNHSLYQPAYPLKTCPPIVIRPDNSLQIGLDDSLALRVVLPQEVPQTKAAAVVEKYLSPFHDLTPSALEKSGINIENWSHIVEQINSHLNPQGKLHFWISMTEPKKTLRVVVIGYGLISEYIVQNIVHENIVISQCKQSDSVEEKLNDCDLAILSDATVPPYAIVKKLHNKKIPHLFVSIHDNTGIIGPLVLPGLTCCLQCMELHRQDNDLYRLAILAQMASYRPIGDTAMVLHVASLAVNEIKFIADHRNYPSNAVEPQTLSTQIRIHHRPYSMEKKVWEKHHKCNC